jgi:hypothetical protein
VESFHLLLSGLYHDLVADVLLDQLLLLVNLSSNPADFVLDIGLKVHRNGPAGSELRQSWGHTLTLIGLLLATTLLTALAGLLSLLAGVRLLATLLTTLLVLLVLLVVAH